jgi:intermembrane space import and assembly protein 40
MERVDDGKDTILVIDRDFNAGAIEREKKAQEEAASNNSDPQSAVNKETGEINWDCPCLADMVKPPCGETFKAAFSCFVYSTTEPKGMDCVEKFREMQSCFKDYPEVYGREIDDDDEDEDGDKEESSGVAVVAEAVVSSVPAGDKE